VSDQDGGVSDQDGRLVAALDQADPVTAAELLRPACASRRWAAELVAGRPYGSLAALTAASGAAIAGLSWADIEEALAAHPRIGERAVGAGQEAAWSAREQSGAATAAAGDVAALRAGNAAYEARFGHVFLICATGRSARDMLEALAARLGHDPATERAVVREELRRIVALRLGKTFR
jgi:2-oxo-4-hydroxy-4-carboxy-5-ureidoimidazoline decarboxylase